MTHPLMNHDIARLRHQEKVALARAAIHAIEAREARATKQNSAASAQSTIRIGSAGSPPRRALLRRRV